MWYGDRFQFTFPDSWEVITARMRGGPEIGDAGIRQAFAHPIGSPPLRELARGRRDAAILIDDLTRPTPTYRTLPYILEELAAAGLGDDQVRVVCALACHRAMTRDDFVKKVGLDLVQRLQIVNHNAHDNLEFYGLTSQGVPVWVNRDFAHADLKIAAGMITPRGPFFGGGCKLLLPGACGWQTIYADHSRIAPDVFRAHAAEVGRMVGLEFIANPLLNEQLEIMAMVTGDPEEAYWHGVEIGKELYLTETPEAVDVVICNAWPKDAEGTQSAMALVPLHGARDRLLKKESSVVIATASPEGLGYHSLMGPGTQLRLRQLAAQEGKVKWAGILFSPNLHPADTRAMYGKQIQFCRAWPEVLAILENKHGTSARVCVFPTGAMQYTQSASEA
jgi:nickel-dependent lactate racemase